MNFWDIFKSPESPKARMVRLTIESLEQQPLDWNHKIHTSDKTKSYLYNEDAGIEVFISNGNAQIITPVRTYFESELSLAVKDWRNQIAHIALDKLEDKLDLTDSDEPDANLPIPAGGDDGR